MAKLPPTMREDRDPSRRLGAMRGRRRAAACLALAALAIAGGGYGSGGGEGQGPPRLQWYVNPDDGGQAEIASRCTENARGRYRIETLVLPLSASDQREQVLRRLAAKDTSIDLMSLDPASRRGATSSRTPGAGSTTVYVTHDQVEAMTLGDRLALPRQGALQQVGTPRERPVNLCAAGFIGSPPMNVLPADVRPDSLRTPFGDVPFDTRRLTGPPGEADVLIAGIRPEQFHDPGHLDEDQRRRRVIHRARVDVVEWLGDEQLVFLPYEAPERIQRQLAELGRELDA
jgi:hypothetical protein